MVILSDMTIIAAQQCSTKQTASKLARSGSSSAAVGEMVARTTVEPTSEPARPSRATRATRANKRHSPSREIFILFLEKIDVR